MNFFLNASKKENQQIFSPTNPKPPKKTVFWSNFFPVHFSEIFLQSEIEIRHLLFKNQIDLNILKKKKLDLKRVFLYFIAQKYKI
jgi:hypothetical protein